MGDGKMRMGTKSLLFGCHQVILHPIFVTAAWIKCYKKLPNPKEQICIIIHDWGYWGKPNMDGPEGEGHPRWAANFADHHLGIHYGDLCMYHSRFLAKLRHHSVSKLCLPDKVGVGMMPVWLWVSLSASSVLSGLLLGDGNLGIVSNNARYQMDQSQQNCMDWLQLIASSFRIARIPVSDGFPKPWLLKSHGEQYTGYLLLTRSCKALSDEYYRWYKNGIKIVPKDLVVDPVCLANWFMSDGGSRKNGISDITVALSTCSFSTPDIDFLVQKLNKLDIYPSESRKDHVIRIYERHSVNKFMDTVSPYMVDSMKYKVKYAYGSDKWIN
jgi:hypothetical protein